MPVEHAIQSLDEKLALCTLHRIFVKGSVAHSVHLVKERTCINRMRDIGTANRNIIIFQDICIAFPQNICFAFCLFAILIKQFFRNPDILFVSFVELFGNLVSLFLRQDFKLLDGQILFGRKPFDTHSLLPVLIGKPRICKSGKGLFPIESHIQ